MQKSSQIETVNQKAQQFQQNYVMTLQQYQKWYEALNDQQKRSNYTPDQYFTWLQYQNYQNYMMANGYGNLMLYQTYNEQYYIQNGQQYTWNEQYQSIGKGKTQQQKNNKLSRNQKRKIKKKQLQQQYEKQKKQIGKWVDLQRKDLVQGLKKIEEQQQKAKIKRKQKLSHLIQIHKQVYKHMMKKNKGKIVGKEKIGNFRRKKKKPSHIKRMKQLFQQLQKNKLQGKKQSFNVLKKIEKGSQNDIKQIENEDDYITQSQNQQEQQLKKENKIEDANKSKDQKEQKQKQSLQKNNNKQKQATQSKQLLKQAKQVKQIQYKSVGKLAGHIYNGITLRQWVDHIPSTKLEDITLRFINRLAYKQAIKKVNQPQKARKLIIAGLHECKRTLWTKLQKKKSKLIIVALNIQKNNLQRGTDDQLQRVLSLAYETNVPIIHISTRSKLGRAFTGKFGPRITMISVVNWEGYQDMMDAIMEQWKQLKNNYDNTYQFPYQLS